MSSSLNCWFNCSTSSSSILSSEVSFPLFIAIELEDWWLFLLEECSTLVLYVCFGIFLTSGIFGIAYPVVLSIRLAILSTYVILTWFPRTSCARFMNCPSVCILKMLSLKGWGCIDLKARISWNSRASFPMSFVKSFLTLLKVTLGSIDKEVTFLTGPTSSLGPFFFASLICKGSTGTGATTGASLRSS